MYSEFDRFKVNWTERSRGILTTSVTGFQYQIKSWKRDYFDEYDEKNFGTRVVAELSNDDGTVTITVSRKINK